MSKILIEQTDFDALEVLYGRYNTHMSDLDRQAILYIFEKYNARESYRERLKRAWSKVKMYEQGTEENKQAYAEYKALSESIKK